MKKNRHLAQVCREIETLEVDCIWWKRVTRYT